ncbi:MAG: hypothetical protein ABIT07_04830 [Ferruginibacter sp.]
MVTIILLTLFSLTVLVMGFLQIPLPFINMALIQKSKNIFIPGAPIKKPGIPLNKNTENEKEHFRFIKKHISNYSLSKEATII